MPTVVIIFASTSFQRSSSIINEQSIRRGNNLLNANMSRMDQPDVKYHVTNLGSTQAKAPNITDQMSYVDAHQASRNDHQSLPTAMTIFQP